MQYLVLLFLKGSYQSASLWVYWSAGGYAYSQHRAQLLARAVADVATSSTTTWQFMMGALSLVSLYWQHREPTF